MSGSNNDFRLFYKKMKTESLPDIVIENFKHHYHRLAGGETGMVPETDIDPVETLADIETQSGGELAKTGKDIIHKAVIIKLNGGLGTSMGMQKAKSLLKVKDDYSFRDIIVRQARHLNPPVPVIFMNSFSTQVDTLKALAAYPELKNENIPFDFLQHKIPKVDAHSLRPVACKKNRDLDWCPPGHGDIYPALLTSGMLDCLLGEGCEYAFISNSDNLGAVMDPCLLGYFANTGSPFMMEVADRTEEDKKGGHLARMKSGQYVLREIAQTPEADTDAFQDIYRHKYFNTNNIWIHLPSLKALMKKKNGVLALPMICNRKTLDPRDPESAPVVQLETAMGAAIAVFDAAEAIRVPRIRFTPVKNTGDLLAVQSDRYLLNDKFQLVPNPKRTINSIQIDLDPAYYRFIDRFENHFPFGVPSLVDCESLKIRGDVRFGSNVKLKGVVTMSNTGRESFEIKDRQRIQGALHV
jgi:UTP--glucose-1-phosphate uridylyltransferase